MFNYFLSSIGYCLASSNEIEENMMLLNEIKSDHLEEDIFLKNESIWDYPTAEGSFGEVIFSKFKDAQFSSSVLPKLLESVSTIEYDFKSLDEFDHQYELQNNSFYGANFTDCLSDRHIDSRDKYDQFKFLYLWALTPKTFWDRRELLFSKIILCPNVEPMIQKIGGSYLNQIKDRLHELDNYIVKYWTDGEFNYRDANAKTSLRISPESAQTLGQDKYRNQRIFTLPDGRRECFDLHIKTGNLRFHFYPEGFKIYIGYIGSHLDTDKF